MRFLFPFLFGIILGSAPALAQTGGIRGQVSDAVTNRPLSGAVVSGAGQTSTTDAAGNFTLSPAPEGLVAVRVTVAGYQEAAEYQVRVVSGRSTRLDFKLTPAIDEINVTARAVGTPRLASVTATRLNREEIRRGAGTAGDIFRGLDVLPGVAGTGEFSNFTVRSRGPRDNLILIDDMPFDRVVHFDRSLGEEEDIGGGGRFSIFAPNVIGGAEFQAGGWQASESGRNGSLLKLNIAEAETDAPTVGASVDIAGGELTYEGPSYIAGNTTALVSARRYDFGRLFNLIGQKDLGDPEVTDIIFKTVTDVSDSHRLSLLAIYSGETFSRDIDNVLESDDFEDVSLFASDQDAHLAGLTWRWLLDGGGQVRNIFFHRGVTQESAQGEAYPDRIANPTAANTPVRENLLRQDERERELGWRGDVSLPTGIGLLSFGAGYSRLNVTYDRVLREDWIRYVYDRNDVRPAAQRYIVLTPARVNSRFDDNSFRAAAYVDHEFEFGALRLRPGVRFDRDGFADQSLWSPRFAVEWQTARYTKLLFTAGVFYQTPRFLDLALDPANNRLENERANQISFGLEQELGPDFRFVAEAYYQDLENLIVRPERTSGLTSNAGDGYASGFDLALQKRLSHEWSASIAYGYSRARRDDHRGAGKYRPDFHRPHVVTLAGSWQPSDRWAFAAKWKYATGRPTDTFIVNANVFNNPTFLRFSKEIVSRNTLRLPDFHALNLRADYRRRFGGISVIAFIDVINAYGRKNVDSLEFDERRGVNVTGDLSVFPQVGLKLEF